MSARTADLRKDVADVRKDVADIRKDMVSIRESVAHIRGRLEQLPGTWAMITTMIGGQIALAGILIPALRFGH